MVAIFQFFHNGWCWYSVSVDTRKTGDPNFGGGSVIWKFSIQLIFMKWWPFFNFFIMGDTDIPFLSTLRKLETQILRRSVIWNFSVWLISTKWWPFFIFFIMADANIPFPLTLGKLAKMQDANFLMIQFSKFSVGSVFPVINPRFGFNV